LEAAVGTKIGSARLSHMWESETNKRAAARNKQPQKARRSDTALGEPHNWGDTRQGAEQAAKRKFRAPQRMGEPQNWGNTRQGAEQPRAPQRLG